MTTTKKTPTKAAGVAKKAATKSAATKKAAAKKSAAKATSKRVTVRMYNVGFGDAFLLFFPAADRTRKVLIDCGVHSSGRNPKLKMSEAVVQIIQAATEPDGVARIDLVVATHRHQDHVEGFGNKLWQTVEVREVWMPWTENYQDPKAKQILEKQSTKAQKLQAALRLMITSPQRFGLSAKRVGELKALKEFAANNLVNAKAMATLHDGFKPFKGEQKVTRHYLSYDSPEKSSFIPDCLPGVTVCVMGPARDPEIIRDMDPEHGNKDEEWFRLMLEAGTTLSGENVLPFDEGWAATRAEFDSHHQIVDSKTLAEVERAGDGTELSVAVALEDAVNGTSLMLMFQMGKAKLFFPGDAQLGTWKLAMGVPEWRDLMKQANFYKVGHHGSHNATPPKFINEIAGKNFTAMIPVRPVKIWENIPKSELVTAMRKKTDKIARADRPQDDPSGGIFTRDANDTYVETHIPI